MNNITRKLEIDAGHRLLNHEGKCANYHGHRYVFEIGCSAPHLDGVGRVLDFSIVKERVGAWLDAHWDHGMILQEGDPLVATLSAMRPAPKFCTVSYPPTAENLVKHLARVAQDLLPEVLVESVRCYETPNCWADWRRA